MSMTRMRLETDGTLRWQGRGRPKVVTGKVDWARVDRTREDQIARHMARDDAEARRVAADYATETRLRTGLTQAAFAARIGVPLDTVRNWEQGRRKPAGPAKALLRAIRFAPKAVLAALE